LVDGDDDAAFEDEVDAVADNNHAGEIFRIPASMPIYHSVAFDVNFFYLSRGPGGLLWPGIFCRDDFRKIWDLPGKVKGKFTLSINDTP
jgi:hypothetical protein